MNYSGVQGFDEIQHVLKTSHLQEYRDLVSEHASAKTVAELDVIGQEMIPRVNPEAISAFGV